MARSQIVEVVQDTSGNGVTGATVDVYDAGTSTPVTIYAAETGGGTIANPQTTAAGSIAGWLEEGTYDLAVSGGSITPYTRRYNVLKGGNPLLQASQVTANEIAALAVGTAEIDNLAVTAGKLAAGAAQANIASATLTAGQLVGAVPDSKLLSPNNDTYETIARVEGYIAQSSVVGKYYFGLGGANTLSAAGVLGGGQGSYYHDDADRDVGALTQRLRVRMQLFPNATAIGTVTITGGLYPVSSVAGAANVIAITMGSVVTGTTVAEVTPPASTLQPTSAAEGFSTDVAEPADGHYILGVDTTVNTTAANSQVGVILELQSRNT